MPYQQTVKIREVRWKLIEKKAWKLSMEAERIIKPTDVVDALLHKGIKDLELEDIQEAIKSRDKRKSKKK